MIVSARRTTFSRVLFLIFGNVCVLLVLAALIEGLSSFALFARSARRHGDVAERRRTQYDAELGWVNAPNVRIPNLYRQGANFTTNARGFRGKTEIAAAVPPGKVRIVCLGNSFTLGVGVDDDETWCHVLNRLNPSLETVNMGQGGDGADHAYLWYRRDGLKIDHQIQVFAFITDDFRRMRHDSLRSVQALQGLAEWMGLRRPGRRTHGEVMTAVNTSTAIGLMLEDLDRIHRSRGTRLVLMHLPTLYELHGGHPLEWFDFFRETGARLDLTYVNLFEPFAARGQHAWADLFLAAGDVKHPPASGHFTVAGNRLVAELLLKALNGTRSEDEAKAQGEVIFGQQD